MLNLRMRGAIPPHPNTPPWLGSQLKEEEAFQQWKLIETKEGTIFLLKTQHGRG